MAVFPGKLYTKAELEATDGLQTIAAITGNPPRCFRCGNRDDFGKMPCLCGKKDCLYCRHCIQMGRVNACTTLFYRKSEEEAPTRRTFLEWQGDLSEAQQQASERIVKAVVEKKSLLLWAVAGSGKTEMLFAGIDRALQKGERVALATPRVDVCLELRPRLEAAFPHVPKCCLYGGSEEKYLGERFVIATTHQLVRYYQAFDTVFIDEVDAFPYSQDPLLAYAVDKVAKEKCTQIYITATPTRTWQQECAAGLRDHVKIPARYHGYPLPVPITVWIGNWQRKLKKGKLPFQIETWLDMILSKNKPVLLFFPSIILMKKSYPLFQAAYKDVESVYAEDPERKSKVEELRQGKIQLLLTTTILERGVTFPNVQVGVIGAEEAVFSESALVQIAGRVGRKTEYPQGEIRFFHYGKSLAICRAISQINEMNRLAREAGLLR